MFSRRNRLYFYKLLSLFSVVRGYNILIIALAQYLAAIFILAPSPVSLRNLFFDIRLFLIVLCSGLTVAAGYIINNFYDAEKDQINKPVKSYLDRLVSQRFKLTTYFILNFLAVVLASYISFRAVIFFAAFIFGIWIYSHKLKRVPLLGNVVSATLAITPFFAVFVYYRNFESVVFVHALFLFLLILAREGIKDLENLKGDLAHGYTTLPVVYGIKPSKLWIGLIVALSWVPVYFLVFRFNVGMMKYYFMAAAMVLLVFLFLLIRADDKNRFRFLHNILKAVIVTGVFSIVLIDIDLFLSRL